MKLFKVFLTAGLAVLILAACNTSPQPAPGISLSSTATVEIIEHKGTSLGIRDIPPWLSEYMQRNGVRSVEALADFRNMYVVVGEANGAGLQQALTWANNFDAQQQIGSTINTRVASLFKANENLVPDQADARRNYNNAINTLVTGTYTGARKESDWWTHVKITEKGKDPETRYTAYVLYTIEKNTLNEQIRNQIGRLKEDNPELDAVFNQITIQLLEKGLEWD